jgi:polyprenyl-phospho-N-acetylgalactosaminyl synthase
MEPRTQGPTVAAVVAAHDEEHRLGHVLTTLTSYPGFVEVIVVDDGSTDGTAEVARDHGATCLRLPRNRGKGAALEAGIREAATDVVFLADADIRDLDHTTIDAMLGPVLAGETDMFVAMRHRSIYHLRSVLRFLPLLGGERAVTTKLWHAVPARYKHRFKIEAALNFYAVHHGRGLRYRVFPISQTAKEVKYGLVPGLARRALMAGNVAAAIVQVQMGEAPPDARARRRAACGAVAGTAVLFLAGRRLAHGAASRKVSPGSGPARHIVPAALPRRMALGGAASAGALLMVTQLVRLTQSTARADG